MGFSAVKAPPKPAALVSVDGRTYPLRAATIRARAEGGVAATTLIQEFANPHAEALEVIYTLPLPADGAVLGYTIHAGERVIRGEIEPREEAEKKYREALYAGKTAGLLEEDRADTFQQRLGNIPPKTDVRVEIEVLQHLAFLPPTNDRRARWEYRFPTVVGVRYHGEEGHVPDSERISPDRAESGDIPTRLELDLTVAGQTAAEEEIESPSHAVRFDREADATKVKFQEGSPLDKDLVIRWRAVTPEIGVHMVEGTGLPGDTGRYALVTLSPPDRPRETFRRDLTILLDSSGSMDGDPIRLAKRVVAHLIEGLDVIDRFEVLAFATKTCRLTRGLVPADSREIQSCLRRLEGLKAEGGTEMSAAMAEALKPKDEAAQRQVILVTDGQISFEEETIHQLFRSGPVVSRVHAVGIGSSPNRALTSGIARAGRGVEVHASDDATADEAMLRLMAATASPVLVDVTVGGTATLGVAPERPADVFAAQPLVMTVELKSEGGTFEIAGRLAGSEERWVWRTEVPERCESPTQIPVGALYGKEVVRDLEMRIAHRDDWAELNRRIKEVAMRHRIVSRRTSLVAVAEEPSVDPRAARRRERLAVEVPAGMSAEGLGLERYPIGAVMKGMLSRQVAFGTLEDSVQSFVSIDPISAMIDKAQVAFRKPTRYDKDLRTGPRGWVKGAFTGGAHPEIAVLGTVVQSFPDGFVVEFEVPFEGFMILGSGWSMRIGRNLMPPLQKDLRLIPEESSDPGPHSAGHIVRVSLRTLDGSPVPQGVVQFYARSGYDSIELLIQIANA